MQNKYLYNVKHKTENKAVLQFFFSANFVGTKHNTKSLKNCNN